MSREKVSESNLWNWLAEARSYYEDRLHVDRIENLVGSGMSDVSGVLNRRAFYLELKCAARPARSTTPIRPSFRSRQIPWLEMRWVAGGQSCVILQVGSRNGARRYLLKAPHLRALESGLTEAKLESLSVTDPLAPAHEIIKACANLRLSEEL